MKVNQIIIKESMGGVTSGAIATVESPMGSVQKRTDVKGLTPIGSKTKKKGPYQNSLSEGKMKQLSMDIGSGKDSLSDAEFKKKYGKSKQEMRKSLQDKPKSDKPVQEAKLDEDDLIVLPGQKIKRKTGFVPHGQSRVDHEVEMARSDVLATMKNAKALYELLKTRSEEEGIEGWVQEKLIKANDYLNAVKEYYDEKMMQNEMSGGVIAAGGVGEGVAEGLVGDVVVHNYTKMPIDLKPGQAQIHGWGPNDQPIYRVKGADGKEVITSNKKKMIMVAQGQGVAEGHWGWDDPQYDKREPERDEDWEYERYRQQELDDENDDKNKDVEEGRVAQLPTRGADYSKYDTDHLEMLLRPGILHRNELKFKNLIRKELARRKQTQPVNPKDLVVPLSDVPVKKPRGHTQYDPAKEFPGVKSFQKPNVTEKAVSKAQQRFFGMAHAIQKGEKIPGASKELKSVAKGVTKKAAHDFAATKHKGLPEKVKKD